MDTLSPAVPAPFPLEGEWAGFEAHLEHAFLFHLESAVILSFPAPLEQRDEPPSSLEHFNDW